MLDAACREFEKDHLLLSVGENPDGNGVLGIATHVLDPDLQFSAEGDTECDVVNRLQWDISAYVVEFFRRWTLEHNFRWAGTRSTDRGFQVEYDAIRDDFKFSIPPDIRCFVVGRGTSQHLAHEDALQKMERQQWAWIH